MNDTAVRNAALGNIAGGQAYMTLDDAIAEFPAEHYNTRPTNVPYTFWHILEHIRITSRDIVDYSVADTYREPEWPRDYWPAPDATADEAAWTATIDAIRDDLSTLRTMVENSGTDLGSLARHADGNQKHTLLREILVLTEHNAYHLGEFAILRQVMGVWPIGRA